MQLQTNQYPTIFRCNQPPQHTHCLQRPHYHLLLALSLLVLIDQSLASLATHYIPRSQSHIAFGGIGVGFTDGANSLATHYSLYDGKDYSVTSSTNHNKNNSINKHVLAVTESQVVDNDFVVKFDKQPDSPVGTPPPIQQQILRPYYHTHQHVRPFFASMMPSTTITVLDTFQKNYLLHPPLSSCQTVCACKWKGGKQTVECIDRQMIQIPDNIDPSTQVLDMSGNKLRTLSNEKFIRANLLSLQKLYLRSCKIVEIEPETFKGLTNLVELDLCHNLLVVVPSLALSYIPSLRELTLASNHIHKIESNSFASTPALNKLDLSHCDIQTLAPLAFDGLEGLTILRLNGNKLSVLLPRTLETLSKLHGIELHDNPWCCDCRMRDAKLWLMQKNIPYPVAPLCTRGPERVIDRTLSELQVEDFACRPVLLPTNHYIEATMGENVSMVCRVKAIPDAVINWFWNGRLLANNSSFSSSQRVYMYEDGHFEKNSRLVLTNAQEPDSSDFYCVAENRAGIAEANFSLHIIMRPAVMSSLGSDQIVGLSTALLALILCILLTIMFLVLRFKRQSYETDCKTVYHVEVVTCVNHQNSLSNKIQPIMRNGNISGMVTVNGNFPNCIASANNFERKRSADAMSVNESRSPSLVQKTPRLKDVSNGSSGDYDNNGRQSGSASCFSFPTASAGNSPDLINDTKRFGSDEFTDFLTMPLSWYAEGGNSSGEYHRAGDCDPSGLWDNISAVTNSANDLFMKRYTYKTPIIDSNQLHDLHQCTVDSFSKTFPRTHYNSFQATNISAMMTANNSCSVTVGASMVSNLPSTSSSTALMHGEIGGGMHSNASTTMTNLSVSSSSDGYPNDYGLPFVPGAEPQHNHEFQMHPLQQFQQQMEIAAVAKWGTVSNQSSTPLSIKTLPRLHGNNGRFGMSGSRSSSAPAPALSATGSIVATTVTQGVTGQARTSILSNGQAVNAKTIRVWQKVGMPVLPPVTALKRVLTSSSRNSLDEGYQEGSATDV